MWIINQGGNVILMIKLCKHNQDNIIRQITNGKFDNIALSESNLADDIILSMYEQGMLECISLNFKDKRRKNLSIPFNLILTLAIAAKMKVKTSVSDIPFAIQDHRVLAKIGYNIVDTKGNLKNALMRESSIRLLLRKYEQDELFSMYNYLVQNFIMPKLNVFPNIHILDCTDLEVNLNNKNYENSDVTRNKHGDISRGYKLGTIRGLYEDTGIIEEICFGGLKTHDLNLTKDMIKNSKVFKEGDILINDRGFLDRSLINYMKNIRKVDTYVPLRTNMTAYEVAVTAAQSCGEWELHPNRENQKICLVSNLGTYWESSKPKDDVEINAVVVWDEESDNYFVFSTTDTSKNAKQIIMTYELRPEIEEDYRQLKDFWLLDDFHSTKLNMIAFHIITVLLGYLFYQIYTTLPEGEIYAHKCLPVLLKNYKSKVMSRIIIYTGNDFGIFSITEFAKLYAQCDDKIRKRLDNIFEKF